MNNSNSNWLPLSLITCSETPNLEVQVSRNARATEAALVSSRGMASIHRVTRSMQVRRYFWLEVYIYLFEHRYIQIPSVLNNK